MYSSNYYKSSTNSGCSGWIAIICIGLIIFYLGTAIYRPFNKVSNEREVITIVTDKAVKNSDDESKYLIFTEDQHGNIETYEITDSFINGIFDSSN